MVKFVSASVVIKGALWLDVIFVGAPIAVDGALAILIED